jgi:FixJ family two-component response regulator
MPHVCIVDDDDAFRDSLRALLEVEGHAVSDYSSGEAFLASPSSGGADCLVVDVNMPGMSGFSLLQLLRERGDERPAIIITAQPSQELRTRAAALDAAFFEKPYRDDNLVDTLQNLLNGRRGHPDV